VVIFSEMIQKIKPPVGATKLTSSHGAPTGVNNAVVTNPIKPTVPQKISAFSDTRCRVPHEKITSIATTIDTPAQKIEMSTMSRHTSPNAGTTTPA